ncbi:MAG: GTPase HflX [Pseudomonadota bacterium]|nr:GTPase HflX [Pseudomonadota bacterium]
MSAEHTHQRRSSGCAAVVYPHLSQTVDRLPRDPAARLAEAVGLAAAIDLDVIHADWMTVTKPRPATLLGGGHVGEMAARWADLSIDVVVVDAGLTPVQKRNLERSWNLKVIDRTALILEIFGARARTHEGRLQVDLAALNFQRSRLVRSWTHLERQRGGGGFLGGPGESQLEIDRRLIDDRIIRIKRELNEVRRTRGLHRDARRRVPFPTVALVGYTNAGKSTLFNRLTQAKVLAKDMLFATLDPTMRQVTLPGGRKVILSDTVGFISDLPTQLVAAFRATLEEVQTADLVLHVRDISHPDSDAQKQDVVAIMRDLGFDDNRLFEATVEVWNKIDLLDAAPPAMAPDNRGEVVAVSAKTGEGIDSLIAALGRRLAQNDSVQSLRVPIEDGAAIAWLYGHGDVLKRDDDERHAYLEVALKPADHQRFVSKFGGA